MFLRSSSTESPARIVRFADTISSLQWDPAHYRSSANTLFAELSALNQAEIDYYYSRRCSNRLLSTCCRLAASILGGAGILAPLVNNALGPCAPDQLLSWGYLAFGVAGVALLVNTVFAGSSGHHRYAKTQLELENLYEDFTLRWQLGLVDLDANPIATAAVHSLINEARAFIESMHAILADETSAWKSEIEAGLSDIKRKISANHPSE